MPEDMTAMDHLARGRDALSREIADAQREIDLLQSDVDTKSATLSEFDALIARLSGGPAPRVPSAAASSASRQPAARTRKPPASRPAAGQQPRSIRVHVLDMLGAENREFSLAEIIDRIHAQGIQAHDDAVRSITIKLMKDGRVERVGRGQYRLARRGRAAARASESTSAFAPADQPAPASTVDTAPAALDVVEEIEELEAIDAVEELEDAVDLDDAVELEAAVEQAADAEPTADATAGPTSSTDTAAPGSAGYVPPLNLGQPWG